MCRSVHAEQNAIISASRRDLIDSTLYLVGVDAKSGEYVENASPCMLCKRFIINAGIKNIVVRNNKTEYTEIKVQDYIDNDDSLEGKFGY